MDDSQRRRLLSFAQRALYRGRPVEASQGFRKVALDWMSADSLLGAGHAFRGIGQANLMQGAAADAREAVGRARDIYALGRELHGAEIFAGPEATVVVMSADIALLSRDLGECRRALDAAYPMFKALGPRSSAADLWTVSARLAEAEHRTFAARTAWEQAAKVHREHLNEVGECEVYLRLADLLLREDAIDAAAEFLEKAERLGRDLEVPELIGRAQMGAARSYELQHDWANAWELWLDARASLREAGPIVRGLADVRMATTAARVEPDQALELLQSGASWLLEGRHRDGLLLVLRQLSKVSLVLGDSARALLGAWGARCLGGADPVNDALLFRVLLAQDAYDAAHRLCEVRLQTDRTGAVLAQRSFVVSRMDDEPLPAIDPPQALAVAVAALASPACRVRGLTLDELTQRRGVMRLCEPYDDHLTLEPLDDGVPTLCWSLRENEVDTLPLEPGTTLIGRGRSNSVRMIWDSLASRTHVALERDGLHVHLTDLDSQHGVLVNGTSIQKTALSVGDKVLIGQTTFWLENRLPSAVAAIRLPVSPSGTSAAAG